MIHKIPHKQEKPKLSSQYLSRPAFLTRFSRHLLLGLILIAVSLLIGMIGYYYFESMPWTEAFVNAAMILSGMGPLTQLYTFGGKIFAGFYALFSGVVFLVTIGIVFAPVVHRFFVKFHMD